jgi:type I restriction enzyme S subunit
LSGKYLVKTQETISKAGLARSGARLLPVNSLIVTTRATLGLVALTAVPTATNQGFKSIVFSSDADPTFYFHLFKLLKPEMERRASGTTFLEISGKQFSEILVPLPPIGEQRRIADILDAQDEEISATEQLLGKLKLQKLGLMVDLLDGVVRVGLGNAT